MTLTIRLPVLLTGAFLAGVLIVVLAALAFSRDGSSAPQVFVIATEAPAATATATLTAESTATATPEPVIEEPVPVPFRSCAEIRASGSYLSDAERDYFLAGCQSQTATATVASGAPVATQAPPQQPAPIPAPAADITGRIEFIGAVWPDDAIPVPYCVSTLEKPVRSDGQPLISDAAFAQMVINAFQTWQNVPGTRIAFSYRGLCQSDPWNNRDGVNTVGWGWLFGSAIGLADPGGTNGRFLRGDTFGQLYEVDLIMDIRYAQSFDDPTDYLNRQLPHIILHEVGHFIGIGHASEPCSVMGPSGIGQGLCWVDIAAVSQLYPR